MANVTIKTAHGYLSVGPNGTCGVRETAGPWETFTIEGLDAPPRPVDDAIDLSHARVAANDCPDVRNWPIVAKMHAVTFAPDEVFERGDTMVEFANRDALPPADGSQGPIAYTLWMGCCIADMWHILPIVECIGGYVPTGKLLQPGQVPNNLFYYASPPLLGYQPTPGEQVMLFCTTGDTRRQNVQATPVPGRTNAVLVPFRTGSFHF